MKQKEIENLVRKAFGLEPLQEEAEQAPDRTSCYWSNEFKDGPATHRLCRLHNKCLCKDCPAYISKERADSIVWLNQVQEFRTKTT